MLVLSAMDVVHHPFMAHAGGVWTVTRQSVFAHRVTMATSTAFGTDLCASRHQKHKSKFEMIKNE